MKSLQQFIKESLEGNKTISKGSKNKMPHKIIKEDFKNEEYYMDTYFYGPSFPKKYITNPNYKKMTSDEFFDDVLDGLGDHAFNEKGFDFRAYWNNEFIPYAAKVQDCLDKLNRKYIGKVELNISFEQDNTDPLAMLANASYTDEDALSSYLDEFSKLCPDGYRDFDLDGDWELYEGDEEE